jgi:hypothetical protein
MRPRDAAAIVHHASPAHMAVRTAVTKADWTDLHLHSTILLG